MTNILILNNQNFEKDTILLQRETYSITYTISTYNIISYGGIHLPLVSYFFLIKYVNMRDKHVDMQDSYANMQKKNMQDLLVWT